ncbi:hypothetical protein LSAT2_004000, partial [Lamellibrachia satsuma]
IQKCCNGEVRDIKQLLYEAKQKWDKFEYSMFLPCVDCCGDGIMPVNPDRICCDGEMQERPPNAECCGKKAYDSARQICCGGDVIDKEK